MSNLLSQSVGLRFDRRSLDCAGRGKYPNFTGKVVLFSMTAFLAHGRFG
jgi:hypothetical protein